ncbi:hypothetical protein BH24ACT15_BH24ACT15_24590 [soil metagenome]
MTEILFEGIRASIEPCSLALLLPALGATVLGRRRAGVVAVVVWLIAGCLAWAQAAVLLSIPARGPIGAFLATAAVTGAVLLWRQGHRSRAGHGPDILSSVWLAIAGAALIGGAAGLLWRPCVGPELGTILSAAPGQPFAQLIPLMIYLAGLLLAAIAVAALTYSSRIAARAIMSMPVQIGALIPIVGLAVILLTGRYGQIIGALVKASSVS